MSMDLDVLRKMTEKLLRSREVFDIDAFGWLNENDVDPYRIRNVDAKSSL